MAKSSKYTRPGHRSSETGQFITEKEAQRSPAKSQQESIPKPGRGDTKRKK